jgi:hypothetical protein
MIFIIRSCILKIELLWGEFPQNVIPYDMVDCTSLGKTELLLSIVCRVLKVMKDKKNISVVFPQWQNTHRTQWPVVIRLNQQFFAKCSS